MTYEEANNIIDDISWVYNGQTVTAEMLNECRALCHEALGKQIPRKPERRTAVSYCDDDSVFFDCPICGETIDDEYEMSNYDFCPSCGQAIDWSDIE